MFDSDSCFEFQKSIDFLQISYEIQPVSHNNFLVRNHDCDFVINGGMSMNDRDDRE